MKSDEDVHRKQCQKKNARSFEIPSETRQDLQSIRALLLYSRQKPLPLVEQAPHPSQAAIEVWSDVSGHIIASPSLGLFIPASNKAKAFVASLALPRHFLQKKDKEGKQAFCKTTMLESLAYLVLLCLHLLRFIEEEKVFHIDNIATVRALEKDRSKDTWATTLVRALAATVVAASLGCTLFAE